MSAYTATFTAPDGNTIENVPVTMLDENGEFNDPSVASFLVETNFATYETDSADANTLQLNANVVISRDGTQFWEGSIFNKQAVKGREGARALYITAHDPVAKLQKSRCMLDSKDIFARITPAANLTQQALISGPAIGDILYPWYPTTASAQWINSGNTTTLRAGISDSQTSIEFQADHPGFLPSGFFLVNSEWIAYNGLHDTGTNNVYRALNCTRGALGSTAAAHGASDVVTEKILQGLHPERGIRLEGNTGSAWEDIPAARFEPNVEKGRFDFAYDPSTDYSSLRATYSYYNQGDANVVLLDTAIEDIVELATTSGGPGLSSGDYDIDGSSIKLNRATSGDQPRMVWEFITSLLEEIGLLTGEVTAPFGSWWDGAAGKLKIKQLSQNDTADHFFYEGAEEIRDLTLEKIASAVRVTYRGGVNFNLCSQERCRHATVGNASETLGAEGLEVQSIAYMNGPDLPKVEAYSFDTTASDGNLHTGNLFDGRNDTAWGVVADPDTGASPVQRSPGEGANAIFCWFGTSSTASNFNVTQAEMTFDARRICAGENMSSTGERDPFNIKMLGVTGYTADTYPSSPTTVNLSAELEYNIENRGSNNKNTDSLDTVRLEGEVPNVTCNAIVIQSDGFSGNRSGSLRWLLVKDIFVRGTTTKSTLITLTDSTSSSNDGTTLYKPDAYAKLIDSNYGMHRVVDLDIGVGTEETAISIGRVFLRTMLQIFETRTFVYTKFNSIPQLGDTVNCDGYQGVCMARTLSMDPVEGEKLTIRVLDFTGEIA